MASRLGTETRCDSFGTSGSHPRRIFFAYFQTHGEQVVQVLYLDESGVEELGAGTGHFVLLGISVPAEHWKSLDANLEGIKTQYDLRGIEIHTAWMARRYSEQESIPDFHKLNRAARRIATNAVIRKRSGVIGVSGNRRKIQSYRTEVQKIRHYIHLTRDERLQCLEQLARSVSARPEIRIFAEAISKPDFVVGKHTPYELAFEQVVTRYQAFLARQDDLGIIVSDNNTTAAPRLTALARAFHKDGTPYRNINNIVETPFFVNSSLTSIIQMADLCAYALRRFIENNERRLWDIVEARVDRQGVEHVGVRHYTGKRLCGCRLCVAHGRM